MSDAEDKIRVNALELENDEITIILTRLAKALAGSILRAENAEIASQQKYENVREQLATLEEHLTELRQELRQALTVKK